MCAVLNGFPITDEVTKENYQIDIINNNIVLYVSNCQYDPDKIKLGISIIDHLYPKINELANKNTMSISNDTMILINEEYKRFINQREAIKNYVNDTNKKLISQLYDMELPNLNSLLSATFTLVKDDKLTCKYCKLWKAQNKKALVKHEQSCKKKQLINNSTESSEEIIVENEPIDNTELLDIINNDTKEEDLDKILETMEQFKTSDELSDNKKSKAKPKRKYNKTKNNEISV
jgi:hypothetical protein